MRRRVLWTVIVCLFVPSPTALADASDRAETRAHGIPHNIAVDPMLRTTVLDMMEMSPAFAAQIRELGGMRRVRAAIVLRNDTPRRDGPKARALLSRYQYGRIEALVEVSTAVEIAQLIAHEIEHVIEFAEGLNYRALALTQPGTVWVAENGQFETRRAIAAGERVAHEVWQAGILARRSRSVSR